MKKKKVLVGMSGGVDSSAVCMMLLEQGYEVVGLTMRMWDVSSQFKENQTEPTFVLEARELANRLGIEHHTLDVRSDFKDTVVADFIKEYLEGRTPNPCVMCNLYFKWRYLLEVADRLECDFVATGHYARIVEVNGKLHIAKGVDPLKDQSYFLWRLGQKELARTLFPLGGMVKEEIKRYVLERGFREKAEKKESMEVCFVEKDYRDFLRTHVPDIDTRIGEGHFVDEQGRKIGKHKGFPFYTIGQRKGLEIALGYPAYVVRINPARNTIRLGKADELISSKMLMKSCNIPDPSLLERENLTVRIRYRSAAIPFQVTACDEQHILVEFPESASAVTPGQSAVIYDGDVVVAGGLIAEIKEMKKYRSK